MTWQEQRIRDRAHTLGDPVDKEDVRHLLSVIDRYRGLTKEVRDFMRLHGHDGLGIEVGDPVWESLKKLAEEDT